MKVILLTSPTPIVGEAEILAEALKAGIYRLHLRRPSWGEREMARLLEALPEELLPRVVLQDQQQLATTYPVGGIHFNQRYPYPPKEVPLPPSCSYSLSCHSLEEVQRYHSEMDYLFLSPIFDSISKAGYSSRFSLEELQQAGALLSPKVFALGGITLERLALLHSIPFGGVVLLGDFWQRISRGDHLQRLQQYLQYPSLPLH